MSRYFHFTLGPVQGFVAQARRTRDFWAGSFILSWLSTVAMRTTMALGGTIRFPQPDAAFLAAIEGKQGNAPKQGNVPNRFMAEVGDDFDGEPVAEAVHRAWRELAMAVFKDDRLDQLDPQGQTQAIWNRQIDAFWDISWAVTEDATDSAVLDRLKNWRTHLPPDEPGVKCMMMDGWQELSGASAPGMPQLRSFWEKLRNSRLTGIQTDLREGEHLCAIAYVKRRFVRCFEQIKVPEMPGGWTLHGWKLPAGVPSTHYLAAAPWLARVFHWAHIKKQEDLLQRFHDEAYELTGAHGEMDSNICCIREAPGRKLWKALDGSVLYEHMLENKRLWADTGKAQQTLEHLRAIYRESGCGRPSPFYAVLLMDGDELGKQMSDAGKQQHITEGLAKFTNGVQERVYEHNGFLVYAGGDDVLALLPVADALPAAAALRKHYLQCFENKPVQTSISAAIIYAHVQVPLTRVLHESHSLLDDVAKERTGRDAVACRIWKPGGAPHQWSQPWEVALAENEPALQTLARHLTNASHGDEQFSHRFLYRLMERFEPFSGDQGGMALDDATLKALVMAEYLTTLRAKRLDLKVVEALMDALIKQCRPQKRVRNEQDEVEIRVEPGFQRDGLRVLRFLAQYGETGGETAHG
ncbi:CRISPR-associated protein, Crm2 family [Thioalkalivibrio sulfidiphilus HL-EbGr7]|uniref:CRISPR-associated protein, Crm2 family n=1 Tax=Thioalkalivibrio sulfidiphilus (strain HL-EbGR7) TaxID=396588 RepID=B8GSG9_THISH|nr:type III-B CRISPR-associated protein Cas10/Cmr2 [Thioalkalivibrio sulfidiphilus]ACL72873.1 CRISPR-associated protein, Crm2 family [Thioalkalivibrio sulfidiphilus HL-EbGr7]